MTPLQTLEVRSSEIRSRLADLAALPELGDEQRAEMEKLGTEYKDVEVRHRALIVAGDVPPTPTEVRNDPQGREVRGLINRANLGVMLGNIAEQRAHVGAEAEIQAHYGLTTRSIPLAMLRDWDAAASALETRAAATIPASVNTMQNESLRYVFPMSAAAHLGIAQETVGVGDAVFPVLTSTLAVGTPARAGAQAETDGVFTAEVLTPGRLQAALRYTREDAARFMSLDSDLRQNLAMGLADGLDFQVIQGDDGLLGTNGLTVRAGDAAAEATFADYRRLLFDAQTIDGKYSSMASEIKMLMGPATYAHAGAMYRTANSDYSAVENLEMASGGVRVSANIPPPDTNDQDVLVAKLGMMRRNFVSALWENIDVIYDEITSASTGEVVLTAVMLFATKIIDSAGFERRAVQVA